MKGLFTKISIQFCAVRRVSSDHGEAGGKLVVGIRAGEEAVQPHAALFLLGNGPPAASEVNFIQAFSHVDNVFDSLSCEPHVGRCPAQKTLRPFLHAKWAALLRD